MSGQSPAMPEQSPEILPAAELTMAQRLVDALRLDSIEPANIVPTAPLFGGDGLGLDSIDALEIVLMIQQHYGIEIRSDDPETKSAFASLRALTAHVQAKSAA